MTAREPSGSEGSSTEPAGVVVVRADIKGRRQYSVSVRVGETLAELQEARRVALVVADELAQAIDDRDEVET